MSTKALSALLGGWPKINNDTPNARPTNRAAIVLPRGQTSSRSISRSWSLPNGQTQAYAAVALSLAIAVLFVAYVFGINQSAAKGYEITKQKNKLNTLIEENKKLLVRTSEVGSILQIQDEAASHNLVQITNQEYLQTTQLSQR